MNKKIRLYWWHENRENGLENYGDLLSKYLVEAISGKVLTIKDAADAVESHLEEEAEKLLKLNKVGRRLQAYMEQQSKPKSTIQEPVTLTNSHSQLTAEENNTKPMLSDDESKREIAKMLRWID